MDLIKWAEDHYWGSLEKDRDLIILHLKSFVEYVKPEPPKCVCHIHDRAYYGCKCGADKQPNANDQYDARTK